MIITSLHNIPILKTLCGKFDFFAIICGGEFAAALLVAALNNDGITCETELVLLQRANMMVVQQTNKNIVVPNRVFPKTLKKDPS